MNSIDRVIIADGGAVRSCRGAEPPAWKPAHGPLATRWAAQVDPKTVHAEYPRPQLVRPDWVNLNGLWDYAIRPKDERPARHVRRSGSSFPSRSSPRSRA